ncbi:MAG: AbrB/MazE/SpoVT family DNA-binding domain-containing protein [Desulfurococcales archaeon]|nr:AbrB/MazE/SpoVT family DNA-binding domain-containing protein [Desulfurococcales archaeon]MCE4629856.1 AbrB/MazE/SpoVT family DNA-binding domain-containing protein [Desulfurococcales archaeon]NOZ30594.1 AbrB/MazE/SpoVT family DNA-binding domain-containing protein [Thermoproteota archaeon]
MRLTSLAKVDSKGRVTIPQTMREALDIEPGMLVVLLADLDRREIIISPISASSKNIYELEVELLDKPGALAMLTQKLAELNVDIVATRCASIARGESGSCTVIVDLSKSTLGVEELRRKLEELEVVTLVRVKGFETTV